MFYDAQSLAFLIPLDSVTAPKVRMTFNWANTRLDSIRTTFDDDKGAQLYRSVIVAGAADSGAMAASSDGRARQFFFEYHPTGAFCGRYSRRNPLPRVRKRTPFTSPMTTKDRALLIDDEEKHPEVVLPDHPYVDPSILAVLEGATVTSTVAGNSFFNPFLWDGIHAFTVHYDAQGRAESAQEWNADNLVRFTWDGLQLTAIRAYRKGSDTPYYQRTIVYAGPNIAGSGEDYAVNRRASKKSSTFIQTGRFCSKSRLRQGKEWTARPH